MDCNKKLEFICYVCGLYTPKTPKSLRYSFSQNLKDRYFDSFGIEINVFEYTPNFACRICYSALIEKRKPRNLPTSPMIWKQPNSEHTDCYPCLCPSFFGKKWEDRKAHIIYPQFPTSSSRPPVFPDQRDRSPVPGCSTTAGQQSTTSETSNHRDISPVAGSSTRSPLNLQPAPLVPSTSQDSTTSQSSGENQPVPLNSTISTTSQSSGEVFSPHTRYSTRNKEVIKMTQEEFNDHCRDMKLGISASELEGSRMAERNFLHEDVQTTKYRRETRFSSKFSNTEITLTVKKEKNVVDVEEECDPDEETYETVSYNMAYINDIEGLFELFGIKHVPEDWRLFLDGSSSSLKAVLLHNKNTLPSVPIAYCKRLPEKYESMQQILQWIKYDHYNWDIIVDFKLVNIISGLMGAAAKHPCIFCLWDSRYRGEDRYSKMDWPAREQWSEENRRRNNAIRKPLVQPSRILLPPLHIKIGLVTQLFKKIYSQNMEARRQLSKIFPALSEAKMKGGVFDGPHIRILFESKDLESALDPEEKAAFISLKNVCRNFLGNRRASNYQEMIKEMMEHYEKLNINITIKMHTLICHLDKFRASCGAFSDEQGERFHQDLKTNEQHYAGKDMAKGLGRYCWTLIRETNPEAHKRQSHYDKKTKVFYVNKKK